MISMRPVILFPLALTAAALAALGQSTDDKQATFFMGRIKYSANDGNDYGAVGHE